MVKSNTCISQLVNIGRFEFIRTVSTNISNTAIVCKNKNNIGFLLGKSGKSKTKNQ